MKKIFVSFLSLFLVFGILYPNISHAESGNLTIDEIIDNDKTKKESINEDGVQVIEISNPEVLRKIESKLEKPEEGKKLGGFEVHRNPQEGSVNGVIQPAFISSLKRKATRSACGSSQLPGAKTVGKGKISLSVSSSIDTTITGGAGVTIGIINANLGTSIKSSHTVTSSTSYTAPSGKTGVIQGFAMYKLIDYDIYRFGVKSGSGTVRHGDGVCFSKWYL